MLRSTLAYTSSLLVLLATHPHPIRAGCYFPDGTIDKNVEYQPCSDDASNPLSTICCATNRKDGADICAPNGLCQVGVKKDAQPSDDRWTKPSCTKADWTEDGCLHVCGDDKYPFITPCNRAAGNSSQRWCCGDNQDCCSEDANHFVEYLPVTFDPTRTAYTAPPSSSTSSSSSSSSSSSTSESSTSAAAPASTSTSASLAADDSTSTTSSSSSSSLSPGTKAGIAIGAILGAVLLFALGLWYGRRIHHRRTPASGPFAKSDNTTVYAHHKEMDSSTPPVHEMPVYDGRKSWQANERMRSGMVEMDGRGGAGEMEA